MVIGKFVEKTSPKKKRGRPAKTKAGNIMVAVATVSKLFI